MRVAMAEGFVAVGGDYSWFYDQSGWGVLGFVFFGIKVLVRGLIAVAN